MLIFLMKCGVVKFEKKIENFKLKISYFEMIQNIMHVAECKSICI